ncbi:ABC transporter ATP-binding protein [Rhizobium sp. TRM96647]|uniref:ABC transporter ATP-binding protein n=1 Tax=unclassified Rhizobium TaxID=2613769 RepID=UPI0021E7FB7A|nr:MULTISPECIES: ABC transporter ATP-binding protein [unclassified Rhizobium]MCV3739360.1 ABC transporter ATP-binding protein [Rhizobium sp. TRM96647]MCV3761026.1 ABC transporter ATP-binding protein [Rhizobium sp. TRM96650]
MNDSLLLEDVSIRYGRHLILEGVNSRLNTGQIVGLVGPNGTGKSSLMGAITGLIHCEGEITFADRPIDPRLVGYMPQHAAVRAQLSVLEVVLLGRHERLGLRVDQRLLAAAINILDSFGIAELAQRPIHTLSGGQQQMVLLAQRMLREPRLLLLDEATSALDLAHQMKVFDLLKAYVRRTGALVMIAIHDLNLAARHADSVLMLKHGGLAGSGRFDDVVTSSALRSVYGVEAEFLTGSASGTVVLPVCAVA